MRFLQYLIILMSSTLCVLATPASSQIRREIRSPRIVVWAWERPEDLRYIDPDQVEVAVLTQTALLFASSIKVRRREQSLRLPKGTGIIAVTRVETDRRIGAALTGEQLEKLSLAIVSSCASARGVQIDFDAKVSEREFYRKLLNDVRAKLPPEKLLSMTSLASWSFFDDWLGDRPSVDEIVPMFFSMGAGKSEVCDLLKRNRLLKAAYRKALGLSIDERETNKVVLAWAAANQKNTRTYVFNPRPWTADAIRDALELVGASRSALRSNDR